MIKSTFGFALTLVLGGCAVPYYPAHYYSRPVPTACGGAAVYEVVQDSWCGGSCQSYPVSHRSRDTRLENNRVELSHTRPFAGCSGN